MKLKRLSSKSLAKRNAVAWRNCKCSKMSDESEDAAKAAVDNRSKTSQPTSGYKSKIVLLLASILVAIVAVAIDRLIITPVLLKETEYQGEIIGTSARYDVVDEEVMSLFVTFDENLDGFLDLSEFVKVANRILHRKVSSPDFTFGENCRNVGLQVIPAITSTDELHKIAKFTTPG